MDRWPGSCGAHVPGMLILGSGMRGLKSENPIRKNGAAENGESLSSSHSKYSRLLANIKPFVLLAFARDCFRYR